MSGRFSIALILLFVATGGLNGQGRHVFVVQPTSSFTFGGTVAIPPLGPQPIVGQPTNSFTASGTADADLTTSGGTATAGQFVPGGLVRVPPLTAVVPNPLPFLPPAASINVTGTTLEFTSTPFVVAGGMFTTDVTATILSGTATVNVLGLSSSTVPLANTVTTPQTVTGSFVSTPTGYAISVPLNLTFPLNDPATGATGNLTLTGSLIADYQPLNSDTLTVSVSTGGVQTLQVSTGGNFGGDMYAVLASSSGTSPGIILPGGLILPLNPDPTFVASINNANMPPLGNTIGTLDAFGRAVATITVPGGLPPTVAGQTYDFAFATADAAGNVGMVSNPFQLILVP